MRIAITPVEFDEVRKKMNALPVVMQAEVYGAGFLEQARRAARKSRRLVLPRSKGPALTRRGLPRRHLADSIRAVKVAWHWGGSKVPGSAAIVLAEQPHAHLIERGTVRMKARPFLEPPLREMASLMQGFRIGSAKSFRRAIARLEEGKMSGLARKYYRVHVPGWS